VVLRAFRHGAVRHEQRVKVPSNLLDDIVEPWAQSTTGDDRRPDVAGFEVELAPWPCLDKGGVGGAVRVAGAWCQ
jgi:hypothetical protein